MSNVRAIIAAIWGLLVEDGALAVGIIAALAVTWLAPRHSRWPRWIRSGGCCS